MLYHSYFNVRQEGNIDYYENFYKKTNKDDFVEFMKITNPHEDVLIKIQGRNLKITSTHKYDNEKDIIDVRLGDKELDELAYDYTKGGNLTIMNSLESKLHILYDIRNEYEYLI